MNDKIAKATVDKVLDTKSIYANLKREEEKLLAQLKKIKEEIEIAENGIITEKLNTALHCLADVDKLTGGYYRCTIETYCDNCEEEIEVDVDLAEIIQALQEIR